jgi:hypothetical protein
MSVAYAASYIDALFEKRDASALHAVISVRSRSARLPDECALFLRVLEWLGSDWQYYDTIKEEDYQEVCRLLEKFEMQEALTAFKRGRSAPDDSTELQRWFEAHESGVSEELFRHVKHVSGFLKKNEG